MTRRVSRRLFDSISSFVTSADYVSDKQAVLLFNENDKVCDGSKWDWERVRVGGAEISEVMRQR